MKIAIPHKNLVKIWDTETLEFTLLMEMLTINEAVKLASAINNKIFEMDNKKE